MILNYISDKNKSTSGHRKHNMGRTRRKFWLLRFGKNGLFVLKYGQKRLSRIILMSKSKFLKNLRKDFKF